MSRPSEKAVEAATEAIGGHAHGALAVAHDPALGEDASVRLGDVLDALEREYERGDPGYAASPDYWVGLAWARTYIEREHREGRL
jgi:hypothetical protein